MIFHCKQASVFPCTNHIAYVHCAMGTVPSVICKYHDTDRMQFNIILTLTPPKQILIALSLALLFFEGFPLWASAPPPPSLSPALSPSLSLSLSFSTLSFSISFFFFFSFSLSHSLFLALIDAHINYMP